MEPQIKYARTTDGLNIAYYAIGSGPVLVVTPPSITHAIELEWQIPSLRRIAEYSARALTYVRFDIRGAGLSDRPEGEFTIDAFVRDLEAVVNAVSPSDPVAVYATGTLGPVGVTFATRQPQRISKLILWSTAATGEEMDPEPLRRVRSLAEVDWQLAVAATAQAVDSFEDPELARRFADMMRHSDPDTFVRFEAAVRRWDVRELLPQISVPTLVMHPRSSRYYPVANAQRLAAAIPGAQLRLLETSSVLAGSRDVAAVAAAFLLEGQSGASSLQSMLVVLFADIADSTAITQQIGDAAFHERSSALEELLRAAIARLNGRAVEGRTLGDGVLATFRSANEAIDAARRCARAGQDVGLPIHLGLHAGDVIREDNNVYGGAVNIAARICGLSRPGEILVSGTIRDLARTSAGAAFEDRGEHALKGIEEPLRVFAVR